MKRLDFQQSETSMDGAVRLAREQLVPASAGNEVVTAYSVFANTIVEDGQTFAIPHDPEDGAMHTHKWDVLLMRKLPQVHANTLVVPNFVHALRGFAQAAQETNLPQALQAESSRPNCPIMLQATLRAVAERVTFLLVMGHSLERDAEPGYMNSLRESLQQPRLRDVRSECRLALWRTLVLAQHCIPVAEREEVDWRAEPMLHAALLPSGIMHARSLLHISPQATPEQLEKSMQAAEPRGLRFKIIE